MIKKRMQRLIALILTVTLVFGNSSLTALASTGGAHIDSGSDGVDRLVGGSGGSSKYTGLIRL